MIFIFKQRLTREISSSLQSFLGPGIVRKFQVVRPSSSLESREKRGLKRWSRNTTETFFSLSQEWKGNPKMAQT